MDRAYLDFMRLNCLDTVGAFFIVRAKSNTKFHRRYSWPVDKKTGLRCDQIIVLTGNKGQVERTGLTIQTYSHYVWG